MSIQELYSDHIGLLYIHADPATARALSSTDKRLREIFFYEHIQEALISSHYGCVPNSSMLASTHYQALASSRGKYSTVLMEGYCGEQKEVIKDLYICPQGKIVISSSADKTIVIKKLCTKEKIIIEGCAPLPLTWFVGLRVNSDFSQALFVTNEGKNLQLIDIHNGSYLRTLIGHESAISCFQISPDGTRAISGDIVETLKLWDLRTGECLKTLVKKGHFLESLEINPDGTKALLAWNHFDLRAEGKIPQILELWDLDAGKCTQTLKGHTDYIGFMKISPNERLALTGGTDDDRSLRLWDLSTGKCLHSMGEEDRCSKDHIEVNADWTRAYSPADPSEGGLKIWDLSTGELLKTLVGYKAPVIGLKISADERRAFTLCEGNHRLAVWDLSVGKVVNLIPRNMMYSSQQTHPTMSMSADGLRAVFGLPNGKIQTISLAPSFATQAVFVSNLFRNKMVQAQPCFDQLPYHVKDAIFKDHSEQLTDLQNTDSEKALALLDYAVKEIYPKVGQLIFKGAVAFRENRKSIQNASNGSIGQITRCFSLDQMRRVFDLCSEECLVKLEKAILAKDITQIRHLLIVWFAFNPGVEEEFFLKLQHLIPEKYDLVQLKEEDDSVLIPFLELVQSFKPQNLLKRKAEESETEVGEQRETKRKRS